MNGGSRNIVFLVGCAAIALMATNPALAQAAVESLEVSHESSGKIIVPAQRRAESARDVSMSLTVASAVVLERTGIMTVRDLGIITPGLKVDRHGTYTQPSIRGIRAQDGSAGNDANVALYVDGVYQPIQAANAFEFPDVTRIEAAKGPQGTLFGHNAADGAIQIFIRAPEYDFGRKLTASYGSFDERALKGYANIPLIDGVVAMIITGLYQASNGYYKDLLISRNYSKIKLSLVGTC